MTSERLLLDVMLGKLVTYLRMCGYDVVAAHELGLEADEEIRELARGEGRTLLTRDEELAGRTAGAILLESREIADQLAELSAAGFRLTLPEQPQRCSVCNGRVQAIDTSEHPEHAPDDEKEVWQCLDCRQHFWKGSHWDQVSETLTAARESGDEDGEAG